MHRLLLAAVLAATAFQPALSQSVQKYEFRGVWVATVLGLDWPSSTDTEAQKAQLIQILDGLKAVGANAVIFQVRPEAERRPGQSNRDGRRRGRGA